MKYNAERACNYCGSIYKYNQAQEGRSKFCCRSCSSKSMAGNKRHRKLGRVKLNCLRCKNEYEVTHSRSKSSKYCSRICATKNSLTQREVKCHMCSRLFMVIHSRMNIAKFCSHACRLKNRTITSKEHRKCLICKDLFYAYKKSSKKYCSIQCCNKQKIKDGAPSFAAVRASMKKAGEIVKCERCGFEKYPHILGIHHKDRDRNNNVRDNLEVLCPNCHSLEHLSHICHGFQK